MREILFRGKVPEDSRDEELREKWVEGNLVHQTEYYGSPVDRYHILYTGEFHCDFYDSVEVVPKTVGQFTGLLDKNGTKIFEGDIIYNGHGYPGVVKWSYGTFIVRFAVGDDWDISQYVKEEYTEIIGNIYDNPELLEVE